MLLWIWRFLAKTYDIVSAVTAQCLKMKKFDIKQVIKQTWAEPHPHHEFLRQFACINKNIQLLIFMVFMRYLGFEIIFILIWLAWWFVKMPFICLYGLVFDF